MNFKQQAAAKASTLVSKGDIVGLGAGSTIAYVVEFLKKEIEEWHVIKICYFFIYYKAIAIKRKTRLYYPQKPLVKLISILTAVINLTNN